MKKKGQYEAGIFFSALLIVAVITTIILIGQSFNKDKVKPCKIEDWNVEKIYSLSADNSLSGTFFLGIGGINENVKYYFYKQQNEGYVLEHVYADYTKIVETNDREPAYVKRRLVDESSVFVGCDSKGMDTMDTLYVPIGTIKKEFKGYE